LVADVAVVAVAALPEMDIPHVPEAPDPDALGAPTVLYEIVTADDPLNVAPEADPLPELFIVNEFVVVPPEGVAHVPSFLKKVDVLPPGAEIV
jgi:hypothetical protein